MRFSVCDLRGPGGAPGTGLDVSLGTTAPDVTLAELLTALAGRYPGWLVAAEPLAAARLELDGEPVDPGQLVADAALRSGSVLALRSAPGPGQPDGIAVDGPGTAAPLVRLARIAGPDSGTALGIGPGAFLLGPTGVSGLSHGPVRRPVLRIDVPGPTGPTIRAIGDTPVRVDGHALAADADAEGRVVVAGGVAFRLSPVPPGAARAPDTDVDAYGRSPLIRTPRVTVPPPSAEVPVPAPPVPLPPPAPPSWLMMLAPLPVGIVMALVFSPIFLIMIVMTPLMGLARWAEGKHRAKKDAARLAAGTAAAVERFAAALDETRDAVAAAARDGWADLAELADRARSGRGLWQVRSGDPDELQVSLGLGGQGWQPELGRSRETLRAVPALAEVLTGRTHLVDVPRLADLRDRSGLGLVGDPAVARALAGAVILDVASRHGPADVELVLLADPARLPDWDWLKWLPHLAGPDGTPRVATTAEAALALLARAGAGSTATGTAIASRDNGPHVLVFVDGEALLTGAVAAQLGRLARGRGRALVVAEQAGRLPSVCRTFVEVEPDGRATLTDTTTGERAGGLLAVQAAPSVCATTARALARWTDPEQPTAASLLPDRVRLIDLVRSDGDAGASVLDAATVARWWRQPEPGLRATIGLTERGALAVDLLADGPHGLVVGTTGAGKSELLRTLVASLGLRYSPDDLTFLLVDFKGGGAFDACAGLPHTVGLVTDLDEHLAARALRCLRAELRHRERRLREAGVSDLRDYAAPHPPLPRLVIVVDEFATLAAELPGFLSALVDVAQRGRSLGIHLILATQRPQGVVDAKIRANTNLRVALRVQDDADSRDVLGTRQAADIDRRHPGRGYVRLGVSEVVAVQSALVSAAVGPATAERVEVTAFQLAPVADPVPAAPAAVSDPAPPTDLELLVSAVTAAADQGGYAPPRVPWPPPLPSEVDAWTLPASLPSEVDGWNRSGDTGAVALGLVDLPDEQRLGTYRWRPETGGTLVLGADPVATAAVLAACCLALARLRPPDRQEIVILDGTGGLGELAGLPHVTAAVGVDDTERLTRVLDRLDAEVARRRGGGTSGAEILFVLAGWSAVVEAAERAGVGDAAARLERLLRDGSTVGLRLVVSAAHERAVPGRVLAQLPTKLCLRLADPSSYTALGLRARELPELSGLRAIDLHLHQEVHIGQYGDGRSGSLAAAAGRIAQAYPRSTAGREIGVLPERVPASEVLAASAVAGTTWRLGVGRYYRDLQVASLSLAPGMHGVIAGPPGSGRTTALRVLAAAAHASAPEAVVCVVAADRQAWATDPVAEVVGSFEELTYWPPAGRGLLLVDGIEVLGPGAATALDRLLPATPPGAHAVIAGRAEAFRGMQTWQRMVTLSRTGLLLRPGSEDGEVLRIRLPREAPPRAVPGRGYLVEAGGAAQVQVASFPAAAVVAPGLAAVPAMGLVPVTGSAPAPAAVAAPAWAAGSVPGLAVPAGESSPVPGSGPVFRLAAVGRPSRPGRGPGGPPALSGQPALSDPVEPGAAGASR